MSAAKYLSDFCYSSDFRLELAREQLREIVHFLPISFSLSLLSIHGGSGSVVFHSYHVRFPRKVIQEAYMRDIANDLMKFTQSASNEYFVVTAFRPLDQYETRFGVGNDIYYGCKEMLLDLKHMNESEMDEWLNKMESELDRFFAAYGHDVRTYIIGSTIYQEYQEVVQKMRTIKNVFGTSQASTSSASRGNIGGGN